MNATIQPMTIADYDEVFALWQRTDGVGLNESDTRENIAIYLERNPGMNFLARDAEGRVIAAVLCGHDGRRGYLHHLAVDAQHRGKGLAKGLLNACFDQLRAAGITRCNIFVFADNAGGQSFWRHVDWNARTDLLVMQKQV
jgi:ribosomal protein S18 acetylase RimI-like enzyme